MSCLNKVNSRYENYLSFSSETEFCHFPTTFRVFLSFFSLPSELVLQRVRLGQDLIQYSDICLRAIVFLLSCSWKFLFFLLVASHIFSASILTASANLHGNDWQAIVPTDVIKKQKKKTQWHSLAVKLTNFCINVFSQLEHVFIFTPVAMETRWVPACGVLWLHKALTCSCPLRM